MLSVLVSKFLKKIQIPIHKRRGSDMIERTGVMTIHGKPLTLVGEAVKAGG